VQPVLQGNVHRHAPRKSPKKKADEQDEYLVNVAIKAEEAPVQANNIRITKIAGQIQKLNL